MSAVEAEVLEPTDRIAKLDFLWLELTHRCNLECIHCYTDSSPDSGGRDTLQPEEYERALLEARELGCQAVQFIGGEPTLNRALPRLIRRAREAGYEFVEVYTNLTALPETLLQVFVANGVAVATSFFSADPAEHDRITSRAGSHRRTVANIDRVLKAALRLRVGLIAVGDPAPDLEAARQFLHERGVRDVREDRVRSFGRGGDRCAMGELCGGCAADVLAVGPDGQVAPCVMSQPWAVGSIRDASLTAIARSERLGLVRAQIGAATRRISACGPDDPNCAPNCSPNTQCQPCAPNGGSKCQPNDWCNPGK